jgi:aryl-alcohol dehydrogenase-like predicted oxidoreductase
MTSDAATSPKTPLATSILGRTGISVTRLSAGGHFTNGPTAHNDIPRRVGEINHQIDKGITYFDVQWDPEELAMAEVMKTRAGEITVAWPLHGVTQRGGDVTVQYIVDYCHDHRKRYGIDHVNILLWVALELYPESQDRAMEQVRAAFAQLKAEGFCDHLAFSCHHSPEMALHAVKHFSEDFDLLMVPFGVFHPAAGRELYPLAKSRGMGTVAMKAFGGGDGFLNKVWSGTTEVPELAKWKGTGKPYQAGIKWVLANPDLDCTVPGLHSFQEIDELVAASMSPLNKEDEALLAELKAAQETCPAQFFGKGWWA